MTVKKIVDGLYFTIEMMLFNPITGETKVPDELNEDDRTTYDACMGAISVLKAQEPRLVTAEDFANADEWGYLPVWTEEKNGDLYCECIPSVAVTDEDYKAQYRHWTSKPTDEQRKMMKWE